MKNFFSLFAAFMMAVFICGCSDNTTDNGGGFSQPSREEINIDGAETEASFNGETVILGVGSKDAADIQQSLLQLCPNVGTEVTANTKLLVLPELSKKYEKEITTVYDNGGIIAILHPAYDKIKSWFDAQNWNATLVSHKIDDALLFSFANQYHCCIVENDGEDDVQVSKDDAMNMADKNSDDFFFKDLLNDEEELVEDKVDNTQGEEIFTDYQDKKYNKYYTYFSSWVNVMNNDIKERSNDEKKIEKARQLFQKQMSRADDAPSSQVQDVSALFTRYAYSDVITFTANERVRKLPGSKPDSIRGGSGAVTLGFNIYQIHCYESSPTPGDYYLVELDAALASDNMYKGKWWNLHGGTYVRICGFYAKDFTVECIPWNNKENKPYSFQNVELVGESKPSTVNGATSYTNDFTFNVGASASISAGGEFGTEVKKAVEGKAKLSMGWSWTESDTRTISDTDIANLSGAYTGYPGITASKVAYKLVFNNLPKYKWAESYGFYEGNSQTYRSTNNIHGVWVWHDKNAKDDSDADPIGILVRTKATYGAMSFVSLKTDLKTFEFNKYGAAEFKFQLKPFCRDKCGVINIENDFVKDQTSIASIEIYTVKNGKQDSEPIWQTRNTLKPGNKVSSSALKIADCYMIYFTTINGDKYKYSTYPTKEIELGFDNTVYASENFTKM